jgi:hypothetical protein
MSPRSVSGPCHFLGRVRIARATRPQVCGLNRPGKSADSGACAIAGTLSEGGARPRRCSRAPRVGCADLQIAVPRLTWPMRCSSRWRCDLAPSGGCGGGTSCSARPGQGPGDGTAQFRHEIADQVDSILARPGDDPVPSGCQDDLQALRIAPARSVRGEPGLQPGRPAGQVRRHSVQACSDMSTPASPPPGVGPPRPVSRGR